MRLPIGLTPDALRQIAAWLDTYADMAAALAKVRGVSEGVEVQDDLRRWADVLESHRRSVCAACGVWRTDMGGHKCLEQPGHGNEIGEAS